ncbi:MAG: hypothetical protein L0Z46_02900 [Nitrospiraceae bacterium]|nr:hypothetical protein [Nitrospiraceae bacterium]
MASTIRLCSLLALCTLWVGVLAFLIPPATAQKERVELNRPIKGAKLAVQRVKLSKPMQFIDGKVSKTTSEVLEFRVTASEPIMARALDPVLHVGKTRVTEYRYENDGRTLVFVLPEPAKALEGAETYVQFAGDKETRTDLGKLSRKDITTTSR